MDILTDIYTSIKQRNIDRFKRYLDTRFLIIYYEYDRLDTKLKTYLYVSYDPAIQQMHTLLVHAKQNKLNELSEALFNNQYYFENSDSPSTVLYNKTSEQSLKFEEFYLDIVAEYADIIVRNKHKISLTKFEKFLENSRILLNIDEFYEQIYYAECSKQREELSNDYYCIEYISYRDLSPQYRHEHEIQTNNKYGSQFIKYLRKMPYKTVYMTENDELLPNISGLPSKPTNHRVECCNII